MQVVPIGDMPSQTFTMMLGGQACRLRIVTRRGWLYLDLYILDVLIVAGARCLNQVRIVRDAYLGFVGDLMFQDTQGSNDPTSPGLGARFQLVYLEAADLAEQ
jgi:hypothetical protein